VIDTWWRYPAGPQADLAAAPHRFDLLDNVILCRTSPAGPPARSSAASSRWPQPRPLARGEPLENRITVGM
jgi:hypothetical protein